MIFFIILAFQIRSEVLKTPMNMGLVIKQFLNSFTSLKEGTQKMFGTKIVKLRMTKYGKSASVHYYKFVS